jgi:hypothetical protein
MKRPKTTLRFIHDEQLTMIFRSFSRMEVIDSRQRMKYLFDDMHGDMWRDPDGNRLNTELDEFLTSVAVKLIEMWKQSKKEDDDTD